MMYSTVFGIASIMFSGILGATLPIVPNNPSPVLLGNSENFSILSKAGISTVPLSIITGDIAVSPIALTAITGFSYTEDPSGTFATSKQVVGGGKIYAASLTSPTPSELTSAVSDMETAYVNASVRVNPDFINYKSGGLGGSTLVRGLYKFGSNVDISSDYTIECSGDTDDVWIFQISGNLIVADGVHVILSGGAKKENIVWAVAGFVEIGAGAHFEGIILGATAAKFLTGSSMNGRVLVQTAVTLQSTIIN
jgi:hypothetical protein